MKNVRIFEGGWIYIIMVFWLFDTWIIAAGINTQGIMRVDPTIIFFPIAIILGIFLWVWRKDREAKK